MTFVSFIGLHVDALQFEIHIIWMDNFFVFHIYIYFISFFFFCLRHFIFPTLQNYGIPKFRDSGVKISHIMGVKITEINIENMRLCHGLWDSIIDCEGELMSKVEGMREDQSFMVKCIIIGTPHKMVYDQVISCKARKVFKNIIFYCLDSHIWLYVCDLMKIKCF